MISWLWNLSHVSTGAQDFFLVNVSLDFKSIKTIKHLF